MTKLDDTLRLAAYEGSGGFADGAYLVQHARETAERFEERKASSPYPNYVKKIVGYYTGGLFRSSPSRRWEDDDLAAWSENADGAGANLDAVMLRGMRLACLVGTVFLVVDAPEDGGAPYVTLRLPSEAVGQRQDRQGRLVSIGFGESNDAGDGTQYRFWDAEEWRVCSDPEGEEVITRGAHGLGIVPVVPLHSADPLRSGQLIAAPWADDVVRLSLDLYNALSELRELYRKQAFSILTIPVQDREEAESLQNLKIGPTNALTYNPQGGGRPAYIGPEAAPMDLYLKYLEGVKTRIYELANLEFMGMTGASGIALSFFFEAANKELINLAVQCERAEGRLLPVVARWLGREWAGDIGYPRDFNVQDLLSRLKVAMEAINLQISPTFEMELKTALARDLLGQGVDPETLDVIETEIYAGGDPYGARVVEEAKQ